ncbi:MAG TPA: hypothetical protein VHG08_28195 [Longimicrobium sp.]|nr:hypothetical protein [Longimicrobium sp.]
MPYRGTPFLPLVVLVLAAACGGGDGGTDPEPGPTGPATVRIVAGGGQTDTIQALLAQAVTVEVRDASNQPLPGVSVLLASLPVQGSQAGVRFVLDPPAEPAPQQVLRTGADGRATTRVRMDTVAGRTGIMATVGALSDSVLVEVQPGRPVRIAMDVRDTTVYPPATYALQASGLDRYRNAVPAQLTASPRISVAQQQVQVPVIGRHHVVVQSGGVRDTSWVSAVPTGTLAVRHAGFRPNSSESFSDVVTIGLDGLNRRVVVGGGYGFDPVPRWYPGGDSLIWFQDRSYALVHRTAATASGGGELVLTTGLTVRWASAETGWIYLSASSEPDEAKSGWQIWRVRTDGTAREQLTEYTRLRFDHYPDVSPDGRRLAFARVENAGPPVYLWMRDLQTGVETRLVEHGTQPRWSPSGDRIAYIGLSNTLMMLTPAGGAPTALGQPVIDVTWSPDGEYLVVTGAPDGRSIAYLYVIVLATGEAIPLPWSRNPEDYYLAPDWRP